jgi:signal transduction histidine kinase
VDALGRAYRSIVDIRAALSGATELVRGTGAPGALPRWPRWFNRHGQWVLIFLTLLLALLNRAAVEGINTVGQLLAVAGVLPLALIASRPLIAWRIAWVAALLAWFFPVTREFAWPWPTASIIVFLVVLFAVGATQRLAVTIGVWVLTVALVFEEARPGNQPATIIFLTVLLVAADQLRRRRRAQRALVQQEQRSALLTERTRIARELHDVVAHHMSLIAVRAETAPYRLGELSHATREEFSQISAAARESLVEMRRVLGVLRSQDQEALMAPQPGIADLTELVERARAAGAAVELTLPDGPLGTSPAVELSAYRIVQEALSNVARHAPGVPATVELSRDDKELTVLVRNGPPARPVPGNPAGHGLVGMRERAGALGGRLAAGRSPDGGFEVRAVLPLNGGTE